MHTVSDLRCSVTGNPCGTDTWQVGHDCPCTPCQTYLAQLRSAAPAPSQEPSPPGRYVVQHPSHYVWGEYLAEQRARREDPPPNSLELFEGGYDKGFAAGRASAKAEQAPLEPTNAELIATVRFGLSGEGIMAADAALTELARRLGVADGR